MMQNYDRKQSGCNTGKTPDRIQTEEICPLDIIACIPKRKVILSQEPLVFMKTFF